MTPLQTRVQGALDALYRLEDELDRRGFLADEAEVASLGRLLTRWEQDTFRKIERECARAGRPVASRRAS